MHDIVRNRLAELAELCRQHHVQRLELFGSAVGSDFDPERSDVDFLVTFGDVAEGAYGRNYFSLMAELEGLLGRHIDLVVAETVRNPYLRRTIERTKETLYAA